MTVICDVYDILFNIDASIVYISRLTLVNIHVRLLLQNISPCIILLIFLMVLTTV